MHNAFTPAGQLFRSRSFRVRIPTAFLALLAATSLFVLRPALAVGVPQSPPGSVPASATISRDMADVEIQALSPQTSQAAISQADLWQRVRDGLTMPELDSALVDTHEKWFAQRPAYLQRAIERSRLYLFHIVEEVDKRRMPMEIALLPIIESAYNPEALSPMKASGIWQFIPSTGKVFGLTQNGWYDGRRDVLSATRAALDYLQKLHRQFGSWELALAAYNCGEGCVGRAIERNRNKGLASDYLSLNLPNETRHYVPKLLAVRSAISQPERFGLDLGEVPNQPFFQQVSLTHPMEAKTAARLAGMDMASFLALNPAFKRRVIHSDTQNTLLLPVDKVQSFLAKLDQVEGRQIRMRSYQARKGELLTRIADKFNVTIQWIKDHNPLDIKRGKLAQTQTILLPPSAIAQTVAHDSRPVAAVVQAPPPVPALAVASVIAPAVAPVIAPATTNPPLLSTPAPVQQATQKTAPAAPEMEMASGPILRGHLVRKGDTFFNLALRYKVSVAEIRGFNKDIKALRPGDIVLIPISS